METAGQMDFHADGECIHANLDAGFWRMERDMVIPLSDGEPLPAVFEGASSRKATLK
jgi:hypothetical protein